MKSGKIITLNFFQCLARGENNTEPDFLKFKDLTHTLKTAFNTNKKADSRASLTIKGQRDVIKLRREMSNIEKIEEIKHKSKQKKIWICLRSYRRMRVKVSREDEELEKEMTQMLRGADEDDLEEEDFI